MPTLNEYKKAALKTLTGVNGDINRLEYIWLRSVVSPYVGSIPDMWREYLKNLGYTTGSLPDRFMKFLGSLGYTGPLQKRWYEYWKAGGGTPLTQSLFRAGEDGFLFGNFAELDELYTTSTGQTNVATNDDPVGLGLDDHSWGGQTLAQVIAAQTNVITNGDFSVDADWSKGTGWSIGSGVATKAPGSASNLGQGENAVSGAAYYWEMTVTRVAGSVSVAWVGTGNVLGYSITASGTYSGVIVIPVTSVLDTFRVVADASFDGTVDNVTLRRIPGNHAVQATTANRPLWKANAGKPYLLFDGSNDTLVSPFAPTVATTLAVAFQASAASRIAIGGGDTTAGRRCFIGIDAAGKIGLGWSGDNTVSTGGVGADIRNQNHVAVLTGDASTRELWLDGVQVVSGASSGVALNGTGGGVALGSYNNNGTPTSFLAGNNHAALALNRRVTPAEIGQITSSFRSTF